MVGKRRAAMLLLVVAAALAAGCTGNTGPSGETGASPTDTPAPTSTPASDAPDLPGKQTGPEEPLVTIMVDLGKDMETLNDAIWAEDYDAASAAAERVANHPKVLASQRKTLQGNLSQERFQRFVAYDKAVHEHALNVSAAAEAEDPDATVESYVDLQQGCVGCHDDFRTDARTVFGKSPEPSATIAVDPVDSNASQPLAPIMAQLGTDMKTVARGLWYGDDAAVQQAASNVAHHPKIAQDELATVRETLGEEDFQRFVSYDQAVHNTALNLSHAAEAGDTENVTRRYYELQRGCIDCHTEFRGEIRDAR